MLPPPGISHPTNRPNAVDGGRCKQSKYDPGQEGVSHGAWRMFQQISCRTYPWTFYVLLLLLLLLTIPLPRSRP